MDKEAINALLKRTELATIIIEGWIEKAFHGQVQIQEPRYTNYSKIQNAEPVTRGTDE